MISSYQFNNLLGTFYKSGNIVFSEKKNILFTAVGNKVKVIDLECNSTSTLNLETRSDIQNLAISPDSRILVAVDIDGYALIVSLQTQHIVGHFNFKGRVHDIKFSPNGRFLACCVGLAFRIYEAPEPQKNFENLPLFKKFKGRHSDTITSIEWSPDSRFLVTVSKDLTVVMTNIHKLEFYETAPFSFSCNKMHVKKAFFSQDMNYFFTVDKGAVMCVWKWVDDYVSDSYKKFKQYQKFKTGKKIKIGQGQNKDVFQQEVEDPENEDEDVNSDAEEHNDNKQNPKGQQIDIEMEQQEEEEQLSADEKKQQKTIASLSSKRAKSLEKPKKQQKQFSKTQVKLEDEQEQPEEENKDGSSFKPSNIDNKSYSDQQGEFLSRFEKQAHKGRFILLKKHSFFHQQQPQQPEESIIGNAKKPGSKPQFMKVSSCTWHSQSQLLVVAFQHGNYGLYRLQFSNANKKAASLTVKPSLLLQQPQNNINNTEVEVLEIQTFQLSKLKISALAINASAAWIALGVRENGQLIVWEWRSQSQILNQQCLSHDVHCVAYSSDGSSMATGGADGNVRLWHASSHLCFSCVSAHDAQTTVSGLVFSSKSHTVISCGRDGTVRAIDVRRGRVFRTLRPDFPTQFTCVAVDVSGEVVAAGGVDPYDIYCWSVQTGTLLEVISGHTAPLQNLVFSNANSVLFSASWDKTVRVHDVFSRKINTDVLQHTAEITALAIRPDSKQICVATLKGELYLWDVESAQIVGNIDIKRDLAGGRGEQESFSAQKSAANKYFRSLVYSADGDYVLGCGNSKYVCLYELQHRLLVKKFCISSNRSLDGMLHKLNSKKLNDVDGSTLNLINNNTDSEEYDDNKKDESLPGAKKRFDTMSRNVKMKIESRDVKFSPTEDSWAVAMTEGLIVFTKRTGQLFQPYELDENITIQSIQDALTERKDYTGAMNMALQLNSQDLIKQIYLATPQQHVANVVKAIQVNKINQFLEFIVQNMLQVNGQAQLHCIWIEAILYQFNQYFDSLEMHSRSLLKMLLKVFNQKFTSITKKLNDENIYCIDYIINNLQAKKLENSQKIELQEQQEVEQ